MRHSRRLFSAGLLVTASGLPAVLHAAESRASGRGSGSQASDLRAEVVQMPAWVYRDGVAQPLQPGEGLAQGTQVQTGAKGTLALRMPEGSLLYLGENTRMDVQQLTASRTRGEWSMASLLRVIDGFVRYAATPLAKAIGQRDVRIGLRTATLGIRGTDVWAMTDEVHDAACLFEGRIELTTPHQGDLVLSQPSDFWAGFFDRPPAPVGVAKPTDLAKFMASVEIKPGQGLAVEGGQWRVEVLATADYRQALRQVLALQQAGYAAHVWERKALARFSVEVRQLATEADAQAVLVRLRDVLALAADAGQVSRLP
jgi:hypothetical protein